MMKGCVRQGIVGIGACRQIRRGKGVSASFVAPLAVGAVVVGVSENAAVLGALRADESVHA
jgi:hypothetical protein